MIPTMEAANRVPPVSDSAFIKPFLGSWRLISFEEALPSGEISRPFGNSPSGLLLYQADGHMSAQISAADRAEFASNNPLQATAGEAIATSREYFGYWGCFEVSPEKGVVVHRVEGCSFPNWIGTRQVRHFRFDGAERLILETDSSSGHSTVTWQRRPD